MTPAQTAIVPEWNTQVIAKWGATHEWYPGVVQRTEGERHLVKFLDGDEQWTSGNNLLKDELAVRSRVYGNKYGRGSFYPAVLVHRDGNEIRLKYEDGTIEATSMRALGLFMINGSPGWKIAEPSVPPRGFTLPSYHLPTSNVDRRYQEAHRRAQQAADEAVRDMQSSIIQRGFVP
jgi:hypothetical protein